MEHRYKESWTHQGSRIIDCLDCGYKHLDPLPNTGQVTDFYTRQYHTQVKFFPYDTISDAEVQQNIRQAVDDPVFAAIFTKTTELLTGQTSRFMLDVGSGHNLVMKYFQQRDWQVLGLEPGPKAAGYLRRCGLEIAETFVEEVETLGLVNVSFINLDFVMEHIVNPQQVLEILFRLLTPGGMIRIAVPNDFSPGQMAYVESSQKEMKWICLPDHLNYFSFDSLSRLLRQVGFHEAYRTTNFPLEFLLLGGMNYYEDEVKQKKVGPLVRGFEDAFMQTGREQVLQQLYDNLARQGLGRSIFMYAVKPS